MRYLEHRRHTQRAKPGQHLSQFGVSLARRVGASCGPFAYVATSTLPRAYETALAMGWSVHAQYPLLNTYEQAVEEEISWPATFAMYADLVRKPGTASAAYAARAADLLRELVAKVPDGEAVLVISHGGVVELSIVGLLPSLDYSTWGGECGFCEGARITFDGTTPISALPLRVPQTE